MVWLPLPTFFASCVPSGFAAFVALNGGFLGRFVGSGLDNPVGLPAMLVSNVLFLTVCPERGVEKEGVDGPSED